MRESLTPMGVVLMRASGLRSAIRTRSRLLRVARRPRLYGLGELALLLPAEVSTLMYNTVRRRCIFVTPSLGKSHLDRSPPKKGARLGSAELAIGSPNERKLRKYQVAEYKTSRKEAARPERLSNVSEYTLCGAIAHFIYITLIHTNRFEF